MYFAIADITASPVLLSGSAFIISLICAMAGISGAFLLLPVQISFFGYSSAGVSATNQIFNIIACPGGIYRYGREGRLLFPLAIYIIAGTIQGGIFGALLRITFLSKQQPFQLFASAMLFYLAARLFKQKVRSTPGTYKLLTFNKLNFIFEFSDKKYTVQLKSILIPSFLIGIAGGAYGVGGGAFMSPYLTAVLGLPIYVVAGATLLATFITSCCGVIAYSAFALLIDQPGARPDWVLGLFLGLGGIFGMYCGARLQKFIPERAIRIMLAFLVCGLAAYYLYKFIYTIF